MSDAELKKLTTKARERKDEFEIGLEEDMKKKFYVNKSPLPLFFFALRYTYISNSGP